MKLRTFPWTRGAEYSSPFFTVIAEGEPESSLLRHTRHTICTRLTGMTGVSGVTTPLVHTFAVLWDEDRDRRSIEVLNKMCAAGLFGFEVLAVGERKALFTIVVADDSLIPLVNVPAIQGICNSLCGGDSFSAQVESLESGCSLCLNAPRAQIDDYLHSLRTEYRLSAEPAQRWVVNEYARLR